MLASMTGFGRAVVDAPMGKIVTEIQSVNRKYLEVSVTLPRDFSRFETEIRSIVGGKLARGNVAVRVQFLPGAASSLAMLPDLDVLREFKSRWEYLAVELGCDPAQIDLPFLMLHLPAQQKSPCAEDASWTFLKKSIDEALNSVVTMRMAEGKALAADIKKRVKTLRALLSEIEQLSPEAVERMKKNLLSKISELMAGPELDERFLREAVLLADRLDISEEIARLLSHFDQFEPLLEPKESSIGRKMEFLLQEMGREINTIGSKCLDVNISHRVVSMKTELEKIREQIQNIE